MLSPWIAHFEMTGRLPLLILYLMLNLLGYPFIARGQANTPLLWHLFGNAGREIARRLNRPSLREKDLRTRGRIFILIMIALAGLIGAASLRVMDYPYGWLLQLLLLAGSVNALWPVAFLRQPIKDKDAETRRRQDIMTAADFFARGVVAPIFFFAIGGPVALCIVVAMLAAIDMRRLTAEGSDVFFQGSLRRLNRLLMIVPAYGAMMLLSIAGLFISRGRASRGFPMMKHIQWHDYFGIMIATVAGVLGMTLGGPVKDAQGDTFMRKWIGPQGSTAKIEERDRNRAALLFITSFILLIGVLSGALMIKTIFS